ncbi:MAG: site-specific DNA-methyltransferase [Porphyrobacter sp. IPPAS B-1204]|nr:MAG: site-specific DNA-methyltransferase [Porphyrobacter sp. IPPAS B-1204]
MDPPYNTGGKDWVYNDHYIDKNDRYRHSTWLEFLYSQLTLVRDLLTNGGVILVSINDENRAKLELLMDEALPSMRISSFRWRTRVGGMAAKGAPTQRSLAAHGRALTPMVNNPGQRAHRAVRENL